MSETTDPTIKKSVLDSVLPIINEAVANWKLKNDREKLTRDTTMLLDKNSKEIVMKLLGFNITYGNKWELDHCNGRSGNSSAGDYLKEQQSEIIKEWLQKVPMPVMTPAELKKLSADAKHDYKYAFEKAIRVLVTEAAQKDAADVMRSLTECKDVAAYLHAMRLINGEWE